MSTSPLKIDYVAIRLKTIQLKADLLCTQEQLAALWTDIQTNGNTMEKSKTHRELVDKLYLLAFQAMHIN